MARHRREDDRIWSIAQLIGLFAALGFIFLTFRHAVVSNEWLPIVLLAPAVMIVLGMSIYKLLDWCGTAETSSFNVSATSATMATSDIDQGERPSTTKQLVHQLRAIDWFQFERLVAHVYQKQGYVVSRRGGANSDGGIDLTIEKDGTCIAVQCKHWKTWTVGVKAMREFLGALTDSRIQRGLLITLGGCSEEAKQLADKHGIEVVNETGLASMLAATDARFDPDALQILRDTTKLCPKCEREMVLRTARKGPGAGKQFWGCSGYPRCRFSMSLGEWLAQI